MRGFVAKIAAPATLVAVLLVAGCGARGGGNGALPNAHPDRMLITTNGLGPQGTVQVTVTVDDAAAAAKLYAAIFALPALPQSVACPAIAGPSYTLAFFESGQAVVTAVADRGGCQTVTIGTTDTRQADAVFWTLLEQTIAEHAPALRTTRLEAMRVALPDHPPVIFTLNAAGPAQTLYDAIGALPDRPASSACVPSGTRDELIFFAGDQRIQGTADHNGCVTLSLPALASQATHQADAAFWALLDRTLASASAVTARPDQLDVKVSPSSSDPTATASVKTITQPTVMQPLYDALFALPKPPEGWRCTSAPGTLYGFSFSWHGMGLVSAVADAGCNTVTFDGNVIRLANQRFWDALLRAASS